MGTGQIQRENGKLCDIVLLKYLLNKNRHVSRLLHPLELDIFRRIERADQPLTFDQHEFSLVLAKPLPAVCLEIGQLVLQFFNSIHDRSHGHKIDPMPV